MCENLFFTRLFCVKFCFTRVKFEFSHVVENNFFVRVQTGVYLGLWNILHTVMYSGSMLASSTFFSAQLNISHVRFCRFSFHTPGFLLSVGFSRLAGGWHRGVGQRGAYFPNVTVESFARSASVLTSARLAQIWPLRFDRLFANFAKFAFNPS